MLVVISSFSCSKTKQKIVNRQLLSLSFAEEVVPSSNLEIWDIMKCS
jgi:hypothetical protein